MGILFFAGLDLDAVKLSAFFSHKIVTRKILHRGKDAVSIAEQDAGHPEHAHCAYLAI